MKLINPSFEIIEQKQDDLILDMYKHIELCGRTCYKSTDKITNSSAEPFVKRMINSNHLAMLEHGTIYLYFAISSPYKDKDYLNKSDCKARYRKNKYSKVVIKDIIPSYSYGVYITTNYRVIIENHWEDDLKYICEPKDEHEKRHTVKYTSDIHFYKDTTRHRVFSWAIESTRFCNYIKEKFGHSVTFAYPVWLKPEEEEEFKQDLETIENIYFKWIDKGWQAQQAAYFLIQGTKAEVIMTGFESDWKHFFDLRALGTTGAPHPTVKELAEPLMKEFIERGWFN